MKKLFFFLFIYFNGLLSAYSQGLHVDATRFITGNRPGTYIEYAIPTADKGILFVGYDIGNPGGIIPYFPVDTTLNNVMIGKIDSNRQISWIKIYGGSQDDIAYSACQTDDGGYAVLAFTHSHDGDISGFKGGNDIWLLKIDGTGNLLWQKTYGSSGSDQPVSIANTPDKGLIILGTSNGNDGDVPFHYGSIWTFDWLVIKTDEAGNVQWSNDIGGTGDEGELGSILSINNSYYIVSSTNSNDHDCTDSAWHAGINTSGDYYVLKLDDTGKVLWDSSYGGSDNDGIYNAIYDDRDGTIVITGSGTSTDYMEPDQHGEGDMLTIKVDTNGVLKWHKSLGGKSWDYGTSVIKGPNNGYAVYGNMHPYPDTTTGQIGGADAWIYLIDKDGNELTRKIFGGVSVEIPTSIVPYLNGYAAVGSSGSATFTEGACNVNMSGAFVSYIGNGRLAVTDVSNSVNIGIKVNPNPAQRNTNIMVPVKKNGTLFISNTLGQVRLREEIQSTTTHVAINVSDWASGMYIVVWQGEDGVTETTRFIKN